MSLIPDNIKKVDRDEGLLTFLNVTPTESTKSFKVLGIGVTDYGISYNPQVDSEKWIIEKNARQVHSSNEKQGSVSQTAYKGDPVFEFVASGRDKLNYKTEILDVDVFNGTETNGVITAPAKLSDGMVAITQWMAEEATVEYDLYYSGDPVEGTATITLATGEVAFTATASL